MQAPARIGKYELEKFLGGGMSHVYRARDTVIGRTVAIKILTDQGAADQETKARFLEEARIAGNISHDNIMRVYDFGQENGRPFMVMEYLVGQDLRDAIKNGQTGDVDSKLRIALQIARALEHIHTKRIIHRDIKPENVHLDAQGKAKLMDFGIAKAEGLQLTRAGFSLGTPYYMAPEQVMGEPLTERADVYAFGILLFELLAGVKPITGETVERLFYQILNEPINLEPLRAARVPEPVVQLVARCTAKRPADRVPSSAAVIAEIEKLLHKPTAVHTQPHTGHTATPPGINGKVIAIGLGVFVLAAAGLLAYLKWPKAPPVLPESIITTTGTMYLVPHGEFPAGPNGQKLVVPAFYIDRTEVTNEQYAKFCRETARRCPQDLPSDAPGFPVVDVTVVDAQQFAKWAGKRLPTAIEWEKAARGTDGRMFPWGNDADAKKANVQDNPDLPAHDLMPADSFSAGASPYKAVNMNGNVWEFIGDTSVPSQAAVDSWGAAFDVLKLPRPVINEPWYTMKGGSFNVPLKGGIAYDSAPVPGRFFAKDIGFRCVKDAPRE